MKQRQEFETDRLKKYMTRADTESAPEGFTDNLMMQIRMETATAAHSSAQGRRGLIPIISAGITALLILTVLLLPGAQSVSPVFSWLGKLDQINSIMTGIRFNWTFAMTLPEIIGYVTVSIFLLLLFDRSLSRFFRHET